MAIALDTTAHPAGAAITAAADAASNTLTTAAFSSAAGGRVLVAKVFGDCGTPPFPVTVSGAGLTWTQRKTGISTVFSNASGVAIWTAFAPSALTTQTVTATFQAVGASTLHCSMSVEVWADNAVGFTSDTAVIGASANLVDDSGSNVAVHTSITPQATGSVLTGVWSTVNDGLGLTADANTSAFDFSRNTTDSTSFGKYKVSGSLATTTAGVAVTFGSSTSNAFDYAAAIEIMLPVSVPVGFHHEIGRPLAKRLPLPPSESFRPASASPVITPTWGYDARSYEIRPRPIVRPPHETVFAPAAPVVAGAPPTWGYGAGRPDAIRRRLLVDHSGEAPRPIVNLSRPTVFPASLVIAVSTTQLFVSDFAAAWTILEGASGGTITAGSGTSATYTAPASPGTFHVLATVLGQTQSVVVTVVSAPANATIRLDSPLQLMDGFGCAESDDEPAPLTSALLDLLYDQVKGIGFSIHRLGINPDLTGPRHDPTDYAAAPWDLWYHVHQAMVRYPALRVICGPWTPPNALKDNGSPTAGHLNVASYSTWANSLASFVTLAAAQTPPVPIYAISPQNEPDLGLSHDSCLFSDTQMRDFLKVLGPALLALPASQRPLLMAPEVSDPTQLETYLATLEADPTAMGYTGLYATHQYGHATMPAATRGARPVWMTEMSGLTGGPEGTFDASITDGIAIAKWVHSAITAGNITAWVWWWGFIAFNGTPPTTEADGENQALILTNGDTTTAITQFTLTKRLFTIGHFSKWIRPGSRRYNIVGSLPANVSATAYQDPVGRMVVVVINENGTPTSITMSIAGGGSPSFLSQYVTSGTALGSIYSAGNMERQGMVSASTGTFSATLPASSVTTFVDESLGLSWDPVLIGKGPPARPAPKAEATLTMGPPTQVVPLGNGWQPTLPELQPRRAVPPERPTSAQAPVQPAAPVIQVQTSLPDRPAPVKPAPRPDHVLPVGPAAQVVPLGMGWAPEVPDIQAVPVKPPDKSLAVLPPVQPAAALPVLSTVTAPDQLARPPRAKAEIATAPTQPVPLAVQPQVLQPDLLQPRRTASAEVATAPAQPTALVAPPIAGLDAPAPARTRARGDVAQAPTQPVPPLPIQPQSAVHDAPLKLKPAARAETALAPFQPPPPPTFFSAALGVPLKIARVLYDVVLRPVINFVRPPPKILAIQDSTPVLIQAAQDPIPSSIPAQQDAVPTILASQDLD
jgi:glucuronoarabinoxylan endo-1,4-beta-xylanase